MHHFDTCLDRWLAADERAADAERRLALSFDEYYEGRATAPPADAIIEARQLRALARLHLRSVLGCVAQERARLPLI